MKFRSAQTFIKCIFCGRSFGLSLFLFFFSKILLIVISRSSRAFARDDYKALPNCKIGLERIFFFLGGFQRGVFFF